MLQYRRVGLRRCLDLWQRGWRALVTLVVLLVSPSLWAEPIGPILPGGKPTEVPKEFLPWVPWVLDGLGEELCPKIAEASVCSWPGRVELGIRQGGAGFRLWVTRDTDGEVTLPGSGEHWPLEVKADGKDAVVLAEEDVPTVTLTRGQHLLSGVFRWTKAPETLPVPGSVGLLRLSVHGRPIDFPRRESNGAVWLQAGSAEAEQVPERVEVEVVRRLDDGVPIRVTTRLVLHVAGRTRELRLAQPLLAGSRPVGTSSPIPLRFEPNGELVLQAHAGEHTVELVAVLPKPPSELTVPKRPPPWPSQEAWAFNPATELRQVVLRGVAAVDPAQTNLPKEWRQLQAFLLGPGHKLSFETVRRGQPQPPPNRLSLSRSLWLELDGNGYTVRDAFSGTMHQDYRLDLLSAPLGRAVVNGADFLVTRGANGNAGVELRQGSVDLGAEWRFRGSVRSLPAVGWSTDVQSLTTLLHLPPGWELLGVSGADSSSDSWLGQWTLWGFFFVLVVAFAVAKLLGPAWGLLALGALGLSYQREGSPVSGWVILLALMALLYFVPQGKFRNALRVLWFFAAAVLSVLVIRFAVQEVRMAAFPSTGQAEERGSLAKVSALRAPPAPPMSEPDDKQAAAAAPAQAAAEGSTQGFAQEEDGSRAKSGKSGIRRKQKLDAADSLRGLDVSAQDPEAVIQTGPGLPSWDWRSVSLGWSGPVERNQRLELWLLPPWSTGLLGVLRAALVGLLAYVLIKKAPKGTEPPPRPGRSRRPKALAAGAATLLVSLSPGLGRAQAPSPERLEELKNRLLRGPECAPCVEVGSLELTLDQGKLLVVADVHAGGVTAYQVPGPAATWVPAGVRVDGQEARALVLREDGFLYLRLVPGRHRVELDGPVLGNDLTLAPGTKPRHVSVTAARWTVDGVRDGRVEGSVHFSRLAAEGPGQKGAGDAASARVSLPPWLEIQRTLELGVTWRMVTLVKRITPLGEPVSIRYPLLPGEEITEAGALVEDGALVVALGREQEQVTYRSILSPRPQLDLTAPLDRGWTEDWRIRPSPIWHLSYQGLAPYQELESGDYAPRFRPWPGDRLSLSFGKPSSAPGESRTIDAATLELTPGQRLVAGDLKLTVRSSRGGPEAITLPPGATVHSLSINGTDVPLRMNGQRLELGLSPGQQQVLVTWQEPGGLGLYYRAPEVSLAGEAVNATLRIALPSERWLLFTWGPSWGPKVLLWVYTLLVLAAAFVLSRLPKNPLSLGAWWLLGLGLTQVPVPVALLIASWFFALAVRGAWQPRARWGKALLQLFLPLWTLVFLGCLTGAVYSGLVDNPDMLVSGAVQGETTRLTWYLDRVQRGMPTASVLSLPLWVWRLLNLFWALWLAASLVRWLRWGFGEYSRGGLWPRAASVRLPAQPMPDVATPEPATAPAEPGSGGPTAPEP